MASVRYLEPGQVSATRPANAVRPRVQIADELVILGAQLRRVFPLSHPTTFISIQDGGGTEIGILRSLEGLDVETHEIFVEELDRRYFTPQIEGVESLRQDAGM
jgi:hypothetical protein